MSPATIAGLDLNSVAIGGPYFRQSFEVYLRNPQPPFITSDSLLNAFHVLLEDSMGRLETVRAVQLRRILEDAWSGLDARAAKAEVPPTTIEPYAHELALVIGPALRLLGSRVRLGDPATEAEVSAEVKTIEAADGVSLPAFLAPADGSLAAIDYRQFRPIGFYAGNPQLARYYEATRWLQMVPLRASRDLEIGAAGLFEALVAQDDQKIGEYRPSAYNQFIDQSAAIFGPSNELAVSALANFFPLMLEEIGHKHLPLADMIARLRSNLIEAARDHSRTTNDQLPPSGTAVAAASKASLRILPPALLPDAAWFAQINGWQRHDTLPEGLEVAAWLGSDMALGLATVREGFGFDALLRGAITARSRVPLRPTNLPRLYYHTLEALFSRPDPAAPAFMSGEAWQRKSLQASLAGWAQWRHTWELQAKFNEITLGQFVRPTGFVEPNPEFFQRLGDTIDFAGERLTDQGAFSDAPAAHPGEQASTQGTALRHRWHDLARLNAQLEVLVQKQLRGVDWNGEDANVLRYYGESLGSIMGYSGNSYENPKDDAPRWTTVAHESNPDRNLAVAVGRPRALYVLYPWHGTLILCRGAVMSYYEYPSARRLTDAEWKTELDAGHAALQPDWVQPLLPPPAR